MDPLSVSASLTALLQLSSTVIQYVVAVKGAPEDRGRILSELATVNSILFILQEQADQAKQEDEWSSTLRSLNVPEGQLDLFRRALERLSAKLGPPSTSFEKVRKAMIWPFGKGETKELLDIIERQKALLILARQNDHVKLSKAIKDDVSSMRPEVEEVAKGVRRIQVNQLTGEHMKILRWLDAPDPSTNYNKALKDRNPKTGSWFIKSGAYTDWKNTNRSLLWLYGIPGCGKTILCSTILQDMLDQYSNSAVLYFYFDFNDAEKQRHEKMIRSVICQLSKHCADSVLQDLYSSCSDGSRQPKEGTLLNTIHHMIASLGDTYIILDALDECEDRDELLTDLEEILSWEDANLHVLATSRREQDIDARLTSLSDEQKRINIQSSVVNADIRTYVHDRLQIDRKLKRWQKDHKVQQEIENTLMKKANGMFRWVACQLDILGDCFTVRHLRQALASLPKTLDETYTRILFNIDKQYNQYSREVLKVLQWLTFSARPLKLEELAEIVAIDVHETLRFDPERRWPEPRDILTMCSSLIILTTNVSESTDGETIDESSEHDGEGSSVFVRLAHFSVKEYLISSRMQCGIAANYSVKEIESAGILAGDCIAYLLQFDILSSLTSEKLKSSPLAHYAAKYWMVHTRQAGKGPNETTLLLSKELLMSKGEGLLNWIRIADPDDFGDSNIELDTGDLAPAVYYASQAGLSDQVMMLIEAGMDVNAKGGKYGNALQVASYLEYRDIVRILLSMGADVNAQGGYYGTALQAASISERLDIVQLLLDNGADVNVRGGVSSSALSLACERGNEKIVQLLLDSGADVNVYGYRGTAIQLASDWGYENVVELLLNKGADVNAHGKWGTALQLASVWGRENVVKVLLEKGADVNAHGKWGTALQLASENGQEDVVKMLLEKGADVNAHGTRGTALQLASKNGWKNVVKTLLEKGAEVNATGPRSRRNAPQLASEKGHEGIVKVLLAKGAVMPEDGGETTEEETETSEESETSEEEDEVEEEIDYSEEEGLQPTIPSP